jgi:hypothetical protein
MTRTDHKKRLFFSLSLFYTSTSILPTVEVVDSQRKEGAKKEQCGRRYDAA